MTKTGKPECCLSTKMAMYHHTYSYVLKKKKLTMAESVSDLSVISSSFPPFETGDHNSLYLKLLSYPSFQH